MDALATADSEQSIRVTRRRRLRRILMIGGVVLALVLGVWYYLATGRYVSTDDSEVMAAQATISANIPGRVVEIEVHDNQAVHRGDVLFKLDERPLKIALEEAQAKLAATRLQIDAGKATYRRQLAALAASRNTLAFQQTEFARVQRLLQSGISSRAQFEGAQHALDQAQSSLSSSQQETNSVLAMLGGNPELPVDQHPLVMQAQAALDKANLDLSYTTIRAPDDGIVAKVEQLQVGDYINAATPVFSLISTNDIWVEANYKEDDLTYVRAGQSAEVRIDAYPDHRFKAHVTSLSPGTGAQFSLLPPENATGNWVKVVQRVPVRVQIEPSEFKDHPLLHSGLSAEVTVDTEHHRHLFGGGNESVAQN